MTWLPNFCKLSPFNRWVNKEKNRHFVQIITMMDICYSNFHNSIYKYLVFMPSNSHGTSLKVISHEETWQLIYYVTYLKFWNDVSDSPEFKIKLSPFWFDSWGIRFRWDSGLLINNVMVLSHCDNTHSWQWKCIHC